MLFRTAPCRVFLAKHLELVLALPLVILTVESQILNLFISVEHLHIVRVASTNRQHFKVELLF